MEPFVVAELRSQPECWRRAAGLAEGFAELLPRDGERVAVVGCGTSWFIAQAYASLREGGGHGQTDAFAASEYPLGRRYDRVVLITRSGTTTEVLDLAARLDDPTVAITGDADTPISTAADAIVLLDFADERSVVQTRFATTALALLRASLGEDLTAAIADAEAALARELPSALVGAEQFTFLGRSWTYGLAQEAALKMREAACAWTESYPAMEYRHGPISITGPNRVTWMFGPAPEGLAQQVADTGGTFLTGGGDPMAELVAVQRLAVAIASAKGLDPDQPRHLTRSVILDHTS
ncbi:fructoselysine-6-P-deglycase FrlB-like protein [Crossiella equi]|uniref:Fructoselysine-6-P-deglycase FrlB-like protein n=1 Tax=Crossiella equi TaxID=130796 RepID=A0ABS5AR64_9PSEU|nr:SIS domain-containing protein [Crossiella equi]MBP2478742.1 fructoselysine-6-P-deglycase FrlB-like protein [Crossiella equi]